VKRQYQVKDEKVQFSLIIMTAKGDLIHSHRLNRKIILEQKSEGKILKIQSVLLDLNLKKISLWITIFSDYFSFHKKLENILFTYRRKNQRKRHLILDRL
jgi:hypothetical protein